MFHEGRFHNVQLRTRNTATYVTTSKRFLYHVRHRRVFIKITIFTNLFSVLQKVRLTVDTKKKLCPSDLSEISNYSVGYLPRWYRRWWTDSSRLQLGHHLSSRRTRMSSCAELLPKFRPNPEKVSAPAEQSPSKDTLFNCDDQFGWVVGKFWKVDHLRKDVDGQVEKDKFCYFFVVVNIASNRFWWSEIRNDLKWVKD